MHGRRVLIEDTVTREQFIADTPAQRGILIARIWGTGHGFRTRRLGADAYADEITDVPAPRRGWRHRTPVG